MKLTVGIQLVDPEPTHGVRKPILRLEQDFNEIPRAGDVVETWSPEADGGLILKVVAVHWRGRTGEPWVFCQAGDGIDICMARGYGFK